MNLANSLPNTGYAQTRRIFLHGLEGSSQGYKARLLRGMFPDILTPDMRGPLEQRMQQLAPIRASGQAWVVVGSSFGGLMAALWACEEPHAIHRLVLLAPALSWPAFAAQPPAPVGVPVVIYHGQHDSVVPLPPVRALAEQVFTNLQFHVVDDDHRLAATVERIDWHSLLRVSAV